MGDAPEGSVKPGNSVASTMTRVGDSPAAGRRPLDGIRVADFSWQATGPFGMELLGFLGAEVIKVESRRRPDGQRSYAYRHGWDDEDNDLDASPYFYEMNLNKLGLGLNLKDPRGVEIARRLVAVSDVVIENMTPGTFARIGLGYDTLRSIRPDIILCSISGKGSQQGGPAYAGIFAAMGGLSYLSGYADGVAGSMRMPVDLTCGTYAAVGILAALWHRLQTGQGQYVDLSCQEVTSCLVGDAVLQASAGWGNARRVGNEHSRWSPHDCYPCQGEDEWVSIAVRNDEEWRALCEVIGRRDLIDNPETRRVEERRRNRALVDEAIAEWTQPRGKYEAMTILQAAGVPAVASFNFRDIESDPHLKAQDFLRAVEQPAIGTMSVIGPPWRFHRHPLGEPSAGPLLGQHNEYVLVDLLGLDRAEIKHLEEAGVVEAPKPRHGAEDLFRIRPDRRNVGEGRVTIRLARSQPSWLQRGNGSGPLQSVAVLELASSSAAAYCGRILSDLGASILKVEPPEGQDRLAAQAGEFDYAYENAGKLAITLNVDSAKGRERLGRLVREADVVIVDEQPREDGVLTIGEWVAEQHPGAIVLSVTPFGMNGPYARFLAAPLNSYHAGGQGYMFPPALDCQHRPPLKSWGNAGEYECGIGAAVAVLAALYGRQVTGSGDFIEFSKQWWGINLNRPFHQRYVADGIVENRVTQAYPWGGVYTCVDGDILLLALQDEQWEGLVRAMGDPSLGSDPRFDTPGKRRTNGSELRLIIAAWMRTRTRQEVLSALDRERCPAGPVRSPMDVMEAPECEIRGFLQRLPVKQAADARAPGLPFILGATPGAIQGAAPERDAHNRVVYVDGLGLSEDELHKLRREGII